MSRGTATAVIYTNRGYAHRLAGDHRRALADVTEAIRLDPKYATAYKERARVYEALKDPARAKADDQTAARLGVPVAKK
jgi:Tfp pilus assembly protein PilF